jgi:uncharacterized protein (TIGR03067 family)
MRTHHARLAAVFLAAGVLNFSSGLANADEPVKKSPVAEKATTDLERIQGTWHFVALEVEGAKITDGTFKEAKIVITGNEFATISKEASYKGKLTLNASASPKTIDLTYSEGPEKGNKSLGIYQLDGDTWTICVTLAGAKDRPTKFETKPDSGLALETLKRAK